MKRSFEYLSNQPLNRIVSAVGEVKAWRQTGILPGNAFSSMAVEAGFGDDYRQFEADLTLYAALQWSSSAREGAPVVVPVADNRPLLNAVGTTEAEAAANAALIDLTESERKSLHFRRGTLLLDES